MIAANCNLIRLHECVAIILIAHPTKAGGKADDIDPEKFFKDSVTFGGKVDVGFAFSAVKEKSEIFVQRIKGRGFKKLITFTIATHDENGNSYLDQERFPVADKPGSAGSRRSHSGGRKSKLNDQVKTRIIAWSKDPRGLSQNALAEELGVSSSTISDWLKKKDQLDLPTAGGSGAF